MGWVAGVAGPRLGFGVAGLTLLLMAALGWRGLTRPRRQAMVGRHATAAQ
jgi:hypothetical protein